MKLRSLFCAMLFAFAVDAHAQSISNSETSYSGATMLEGDVDVFFFDFSPVNDPNDETDPYAFFEGNTLYAGNSDQFGNTIDAIIEFFWFESSIDRGSDFYVAVIKTRVTPGGDCQWAPFSWAGGVKCKLWTDQWQDWGEHPVMSVEAHTDISLEQGAFRWDWSLPFETYGIDAYGQVTLKNEYGLGIESEGAAVAHGEYQLDEEGNVEAEGEVQVKGFANEEYSVKTQYNVTLWEWEIFVDGRADLMAWDMYLNLSARDEQSAYHEYFLSIQVEEGEMFTLDQIKILSNFDTGWYNPIHHEVGLDIGPIMINQPIYEILEPDTPDEEQDDRPAKRFEFPVLPVPDEQSEPEQVDIEAPARMPEAQEESKSTNPDSPEEAQADPRDEFSGLRDMSWDYFDGTAEAQNVEPPETSSPAEVVYSNGTGCTSAGSAPSLFMLLFVVLPLVVRNRY
jgi:hypothetical protein